MTAPATSTSTEAQKALVRRYLAQVVNGADRAAARAAAEAIVAPDLTFTSPYTPEPAQGREAFLGMLDAIHTALPDFNLVEHAMLAEGDLVASRWTVHGTHQGQLGPFAPTGKRLAISGLSIYRIAGGRIAEGWVQDDTMTLLAATAGSGAGSNS